jgi:hypothetical protein
MFGAPAGAYAFSLAKIAFRAYDLMIIVRLASRFTRFSPNFLPEHRYATLYKVAALQCGSEYTAAPGQTTVVSTGHSYSKDRYHG